MIHHRLGPFEIMGAICKRENVEEKLFRNKPRFAFATFRDRRHLKIVRFYLHLFIYIYCQLNSLTFNCELQLVL
jgi:hypothetical protein